MGTKGEIGCEINHATITPDDDDDGGSSVLCGSYKKDMVFAWENWKCFANVHVTNACTSKVNVKVYR